MPRKSDAPGRCWTCRLRRRKCDGRQPICAECGALGIGCLYSDARPEWMDNGMRQKEKANLLRAEIKNRRKAMKKGTAEISPTSGSNGKHFITSLPQRTPPVSAAATESLDLGPATSGSGTAQPSSHFTTPPPVSPPPALGHIQSPTSTSNGPPKGSTTTDRGRLMSLLDLSRFEEERDLNFVMVYIDYVFPFLYPFYRPLLLGGGRGWLMVLLTKNKAIFHAALSLASYFFTTLVHATYNRNMAEIIHRHQIRSLHELNSVCAELKIRGVHGHLAECARALYSIIQVLYLQVLVSQTDTWPMQLDAALTLFDVMMGHHGLASTGDSWSRIMDDLSFANRPIVPNSSDSPNQNALKFHTTILLYIDILGSTVLEQAPRLRKYHSVLLQGSDDTQNVPVNSVQLDAVKVTGIHNGILRLLSEVTAVAAWKKEAAAAKNFSILELLNLTTPIEVELRSRLAYLETPAAANDMGSLAPPTGISSTSSGVLRQHAGRLLQGGVPTTAYYSGGTDLSVNMVSMIWGYGALTYLLVVDNGWQPELDAIRESVDRTLTLLRSLRPASLRMVAWPLCVTGCLASPEQEPVIRAMVGRINHIQLFPSVKEALCTMEAVWEQRNRIEQGEWDLVDS